MNKSDFISDAVALDLGKSGVKVAETLEMQIGDEWWGLINSAEPLTTKTFVGRSLRDISVEEGSMDLSSLTSSFKSVGTGDNYEMDRNVYTVFAPIKQGEGEPDLPCIAVIYKKRGTKYFDAKIYNLDGSVRRYFADNAIEAGTYPYLGLVWDYVNQTGLLFRSASSTRLFSFNYALGTIEYASGSSFPVASADYKSFAECPEKIYSLFRKTGALTVKSTTPTLGQTPISVLDAIKSTTGEVAVTAGANYRGSEAFVFYSRTHESVGVAWVDKTDGKLYYAVESDSWATAYELSSFGADGTVLSHFGNLVLGGSHGGEYYVAGRKNLSTGNLGKPTGYTFPANLTVMGVAGSADGYIRLFGRIGSVIYAYQIELSTMTIVAVSSLDTGVTISSAFKPVKFAESETRELYLLNFGTYLYDYTTAKALLVNVDKATGNILWVWGNGSTYGWFNSTTWPWHTHSSKYSDMHIIRKYKNEMCFISFKFSRNSSSGGTTATISHRFIMAGDILNCNSEADVNAALLACEFFRRGAIELGSTNSLNEAERFGIRSFVAQNALTWGETQDTLFFSDYMCKDSSIYVVALHFDKTTRAHTQAYAVLKSGTSSYYRQACGVVYKPEYGGYTYNIGSQDDPSADGYVLAIDEIGNTATIYGPTLAELQSTAIFGAIQGYVNFVATRRNKTYYAVLSSSESANLIVLIGDLSQTPSVSLYRLSLGLTHNAYSVHIDEEENVIVACANCIDGEIAYTKFNAYEGLSNQPLAIKSTDFSEKYSLDLGTVPLGGEHMAESAGSYMFVRDYANLVQVVSTGTGLTDYVGGTPPENTGSVIYIYEQRNYIPYPFAREGIKVELSNISKMTKVTIPETQTDLIRTMIAGGTDFRGSRCILRRLFPDHTEEGSDIILLDGYIQDWSYSPDKKGILFTVSKTLIDVGATFPKRLMNMGCSHVFKGVRCGYLGADGICTKTKTDCTSKGAVNNFGGFPWVAARQRRIMWR